MECQQNWLSIAAFDLEDPLDRAQLSTIVSILDQAYGATATGCVDDDHGEIRYLIVNPQFGGTASDAVKLCAQAMEGVLDESAYRGELQADAEWRWEDFDLAQRIKILDRAGADDISAALDDLIPDGLPIDVLEYIATA